MKRLLIINCSVYLFFFSYTVKCQIHKKDSIIISHLIKKLPKRFDIYIDSILFNKTSYVIAPNNIHQALPKKKCIYYDVSIR